MSNLPSALASPRLKVVSAGPSHSSGTPLPLASFEVPLAMSQASGTPFLLQSTAGNPAAVGQPSAAISAAAMGYGRS